MPEDPWVAQNVGEGNPGLGVMLEQLYSHEGFSKVSYSKRSRED